MALKQVTKVRSGFWRKMLDHAEMAMYMNDQDVTRDSLRLDFYASNQSLMGEGLTIQVYEQFEDEMETVLLSKTAEKSEARILIQRALHLNGEGKAGLIGWLKINAWYMQTSGPGMTAKRGDVMNPAKSKKDEDVMGNVQAWLDKERALMGLGDARLPTEYRITALKAIQTDKLLEELERDE